MIAVTAATGQLGRLVIAELLRAVPSAEIVAAVRTPAKAADLAQRGVTVRAGDYTNVPALAAAFAGAERVLLISSNEIGQRTAQHQNVIAAAQQAGVKVLVYTSVLRAETSKLSIADEHRDTEQALKASGLSYIILRNGWYTENYMGAVPAAVEHGALVGSAGNGKISAAPRADYAAAAAAALTGRAELGQTYELAGDTAFTLSDLAAEISRQVGRTIPYQNLPEAEYRATLLQFGLPEPLATGVASWGTQASLGALFDDGRALSRLIGRPTGSLAAAVEQALKPSR